MNVENEQLTQRHEALSSISRNFSLKTMGGFGIGASGLYELLNLRTSIVDHESINPEQYLTNALPVILGLVFIIAGVKLDGAIKNIEKKLPKQLELGVK